MASAMLRLHVQPRASILEYLLAFNLPLSLGMHGHVRDFIWKAAVGVLHTAYPVPQAGIQPSAENGVERRCEAKATSSGEAHIMVFN